MNHYKSWDAFCDRVFEELGKSGRILRPLYAAGGMVLLLIIINMLGMSPFLFITWLLAFFLTPWGLIVAAILAASAAAGLKYLYSERKKLRPVLQRLVEAKPRYQTILLRCSDPTSPARMSPIDALLAWVLHGGAPPNDPPIVPPGGVR